MHRGIASPNPINNANPAVKATGSDASETRQSMRATIAKYSTAIIVLIALSFAIFFAIPILDVVGIILFATGVALVPSLGASIYTARGKHTASIFLRSFVSHSVFVFIFLFGLSSLPYVPMFFSFVAPALFVFAVSVILWRFGGLLTRSATNVPLGSVASRLGGALFLFFIFELFAFFVVWVGYPFLYASIAYGVLSVSPLIAFSKRTKSMHDAGEYLMRSSARWTAAAFLVGTAAAILSIPGANIYTYVFVLLLSGVVLCYVGLRVYSLGSSRLKSVQEDLYRKHAHEVNLVSDESFDYLRTAMVQFVRTGSKGDLTIALTNLMTNAGMGYPEIKADLELLLTYELPEIFRFPYLSLKKSLELEMQRRIAIVQLLMHSITAEASARGKSP